MKASENGFTATVQALIGPGTMVNLRNKVRTCAFFAFLYCIIIFVIFNLCARKSLLSTYFLCIICERNASTDCVR
jgi:hypothetical protein